MAMRKSNLSAKNPTAPGNTIPPPFPDTASRANMVEPVCGNASDAIAIVVGHIHPTKKPNTRKIIIIRTPDEEIPAAIRQPAHMTPARISMAGAER